MDRGFILHREKNVDKQIFESAPILWASGDPVMNRWTHHLKLKDKTIFPLITYRCTQCGYLENFARTD